MKNGNTHFIFDGEKIEISPNLLPIVNFLQEIEKEIESFLGIEKQLRFIRKHIVNKLKFTRPIRSEMIVLFAYLETLMRLNFAYENKIDDREKIRKQTLEQSVWESFYKGFCLSKSNPWGQQNPQRLEHINAQDLRYLRNSLTHFFSVDKGLGISHHLLDTKSRELERKTNFIAKFISPEDLYEIIKGAGLLMIKKWNEDCRESLANNSVEFKEKILAVSNLITESGPVIIKGDQINI